MNAKTISKGPALLILIIVASVFTGLGIFLDEEVLPTPPNTEEVIQDLGSQATDSKGSFTKPQSTEPSEITQQLTRAVEAANETESMEEDQLAGKLADSKSLIEETNQLLEEKGVASNEIGSSEKSQQFNQQLNDLKARLVELQSSE
jgi:hypothetical protein